MSAGIARLYWLLAVDFSLLARAQAPGGATPSAAKQQLNPLVDATKLSVTLSVIAKATQNYLAHENCPKCFKNQQ